MQKYAMGDDLRYIAVASDPVSANAERHGLDVVARVDGKYLTDPDGYKWRLIDGATPNTIPFVSFNVSDLAKARGSSFTLFLNSSKASLSASYSTEFWHGVLGMQIFEEKAYENGDKSILVGHNKDQTKLELYQRAASKGAAINHAEV
jgi:hypothetical protein